MPLPSFLNCAPNTSRSPTVSDLPVSIISAAEEEVANAIAYYEAQQVGLGRDLEVEIRRALRMIQARPETWQMGRLGLRRFILARFPFVIHYQLVPDKIRIIAVAHTSRKPHYWRNRT
ncbi:MAG: Plasmid stabilization system protein [Puniceicoccaceae bacterium 5H]|nr:MAG: Plasmid stabilization system protein [Puniceicoccaceae bacterium 5H]